MISPWSPHELAGRRWRFRLRQRPQHGSRGGAVRAPGALASQRATRRFSCFVERFSCWMVGSNNLSSSMGPYYIIILYHHYTILWYSMLRFSSSLWDHHTSHHTISSYLTSSLWDADDFCIFCWIMAWPSIFWRFKCWASHKMISYA